MLAKITGVLYGCNVGIHRAQAYTMRRDRPIVLDTLSVRSGTYPISENRAKDPGGAQGSPGRWDGSRSLSRARGKTEPPDEVPVEGVDLRNDLSEDTRSCISLHATCRGCCI